MHFKKSTMIAALSLALTAGACNRPAQEVRDTTADEAAKRAAELQRERDETVTRLNERVAQIERDYAEKQAKVASGARTATAGLREEVKEDVANVKEALADLGTTTPDNWWDRHEAAMRRTADDIGADVKRLANKVVEPVREAADAPGTAASTAPFTSRRDKLVADLRARTEAFAKALDGVKASGSRETEVKDTQARIKKLTEDVDRLASAEADDWWDVTKARVTEYLDRVEASVKRLDDDKPRSE
jgi:hypothetical protein